MTRDEILAALASEHGLPERFIYLLDVVPLVDVLWADGRNQEAEIALVKKFLLEHLATLANINEGEAPITTSDVDDFLEQLVYQRPDTGLLNRLKELAQWNRTQTGNPVRSDETILDYCLDIAAAAVTHYPHDHHERFVAAEKKALKELMSQLQIR